MNIVRNNRVNKGVALVFALMTIIILFSIATTVTAVSLRESKDSRTVNYNDLALQAANWGIEAAIEYMGQSSDGGSTNCQWASNQLVERQKGDNAQIIALDNLPVIITSVNSDDLKKEYGLDYSTGTKLGTGNWAYGDSKKIVFLDSTRTGRYNLANGKELNNITVEVVCTEYRNSGNYRPSSYELLSVARVSSPSVNDTLIDIEKGPPSKSVLSTRVVRAMVRQEQVSDFMHFVQNARTFDAIDTDLIYNNDLFNGLKKVVFLPQNYIESGRLRVDGFDPSKESNTLKEKLHNEKVDGCISFIGNQDPNGAAKDYFMTGDVTTNRGVDSLTYKQFGSSEGRWSKYGNAFQGTLNVGVDSIGLPEVNDYYTKLAGKNSAGKDNSLYLKMGNDDSIKAEDYNNGFGCSDYDGIIAKNLKGRCPYVAQKETVGEDGAKVKGTTPVFATTRVEIGPMGEDTVNGQDKVKFGTVRIVRYNSAMTASGEIDPNYVELIGDYRIYDSSIDTSKLSDAIPGNTICVEGGNVEVVNVKKFAGKDGNGNDLLSTNYVVNDKGYSDDGLYGGLTIASNVNATRESVRKSVGSDGYKGNASNLSPNTEDDAGLYSDYARYFWKSDYNKNVAGNLQPPYSNAQFHDIYDTLSNKADEMVVKTRHWVSDGEGGGHYENDPPVRRGESNLETSYYTGTPAPSGSQDIYDKVIKNYSANSLASDTGKKYWPTMSSSGVENEGNTFIGSDLTYNSDNTATALGIVAKKSILLNDKSTTKPTRAKDNRLTVNGLFMSIDHSLQFDWRNKSGNNQDRFDNLNSVVPDIKNTGKGRTFKLTGAIVGGFLDSEGDTFGRGYYNQEFKHDDNLLLNPPPNVPQWNLNENSIKNFAILSYEDRGAINITE